MGLGWTAHLSVKPGFTAFSKRVGRGRGVLMCRSRQLHRFWSQHQLLKKEKKKETSVLLLTCALFHSCTLDTVKDTLCFHAHTSSTALLCHLIHPQKRKADIVHFITGSVPSRKKSSLLFWEYSEWNSAYFFPWKSFSASLHLFFPLLCAFNKYTATHRQVFSLCSQSSSAYPAQTQVLNHKYIDSLKRERF